MNCLIIGIDCATDLKKRGVSFAEYSSGECRLLSVGVGLTNHQIKDSLNRHGKEAERVLFALDAPLGWPADLGQMLKGHNAGESLEISSNLLFRRETDRYIKKIYGKQPLDVGADRIARTAHSALDALTALRSLTGKDIPLICGPGFQGYGAIEVYPAATLKVHGHPDGGYKDAKPEHFAQRQKIINGIENRIAVGSNHGAVISNADSLDAVICVLAAVDFLEGRSGPPSDEALAQKEGWIWVAKKT